MFVRSVISLYLLLLSPAVAQYDDSANEDDAILPDGYDDPYGMMGDGMGGMRGMDPYGMGMGGMGGMDPYGGMGGYGGGGGAPQPPQPKQLESLEEIEAFIKEDTAEPAVIGFFPADHEIRGSEDYDTFMQVAMEEGLMYRFAYTSDEEVLAAKKYDGAVIFAYMPPRDVQEKYERAKSRYPSKSVKADSLKKFLAEKTMPLVGELSQKSGARYSRVELPILTVFSSADYKKNPSGVKYAVNRVVKLAKELKGKMVFTFGNTVDFDRSLNEQYEFEDMDQTDKNSVRVGIKDGNTYYKMDSAFSAKAVDSFVKAFRAGKLVGHESKQEEPQQEEELEDGAPTDVVTLTNANVKEQLTDSAADVLVEFYAPWCGHCKALKPTYARVAAHFKDDAGVTIAAMDATANEPPTGFDVQGYPTIFFVRADKKNEPMSFEGGRDEKSIVKFINKNRSTPKP